MWHVQPARVGRRVGMPIPGDKPAELFEPPSYVQVERTQNAHDFIERPVPKYKQCVPSLSAGIA